MHSGYFFTFCYFLSSILLFFIYVKGLRVLLFFLDRTLYKIWYNNEIIIILGVGECGVSDTFNDISVILCDRGIYSKRRNVLVCQF